MPKSKRRKRSYSKSGYVGVTKLPSGSYRSSIQINGKTKYLGSFDTAKQAAKAYDREAIKLRRSLYKLNYPKKAPVGYTPIQQTLRSVNTVGYKGLTTEKNGKLKVLITIGGKQTYIGTYETAKEAAVAYDRAALKANQPTTTFLNFPDMVHNLDVEPKCKKYKRSSTGYRGVTNGYKGQFNATIRINSKKMSLGTFGTAIGAALAYDQAAINAGRKQHTLNFPDGLPIIQKIGIKYV